MPIVIHYCHNYFVVFIIFSHFCILIGTFLNYIAGIVVMEGVLYFRALGVPGNTAPR